MFYKNSDEAKRLVNSVYEARDSDKEVVCYGIAYAITEHLLAKVSTFKEIGDITIEANKIIDGINELCIVDKGIIRKKVSGHISFRLNSESLVDRVNSSSCIEELFGFRHLYSVEEMNVINSNFSLFRKVSLNVLALIKG